MPCPHAARVVRTEGSLEAKELGAPVVFGGDRWWNIRESKEGLLV